ncbi:MAG: AbrB/MazE/SpoVT family DNA-binding domain-containing protein [Candidatus Peribacteraceae bacterium]|nr:AbrB/MazE/SpoVT family DNA-binding domain-containing protein [Candidatus Peribacteraceae bacterium]
MTSKIVTSTSRGQITLPKHWRKHFDTDSYVLHMYEDKIILMPIEVNIEPEEEILFDSDKDNNGKGIPVDEMITMLKKINKDG